MAAALVARPQAESEWDEATLLMAQSFLFANCSAFIGTVDSNIMRIVSTQLYTPQRQISLLVQFCQIWPWGSKLAPAKSSVTGLVQAGISGATFDRSE